MAGADLQEGWEGSGERELPRLCELELECEGAFKVRLRNKDSIWLQWKVIVKVFELGTQVRNLPRTWWRWE